MTKAEAKWLGEEIGFGPVYRFQRLVFRDPNSYIVEVIDNQTGERREVGSWAELDALAHAEPQNAPQASPDAP